MERVSEGKRGEGKGEDDGVVSRGGEGSEGKRGEGKGEDDGEVSRGGEGSEGGEVKWVQGRKLPPQ